LGRAKRFGALFELLIHFLAIVMILAVSVVWLLAAHWLRKNGYVEDWAYRIFTFLDFCVTALLYLNVAAETFYRMNREFLRTLGRIGKVSYSALEGWRASKPMQAAFEQKNRDTLNTVKADVERGKQGFAND
jgi:ABC-type anion transport system duplicated permease subunit